jgi:NAD(P)-dependent dehydrogenase (short-subunit alcohol dehydrogenase family)
MNAVLEELFSLAGRVALVTGASSGIGRSIALALAGAGAQVVLVARDENRLRSTAAEVGSAGAYLCVDLADRAALAAALPAMARPFGDPDILVNGAGVNRRPHLDALTVDDWDVTMAVNLAAPFLLGQHFGTRMAARGWGRIINIVSQQAVRAFGNSGAYGAAKAGLAGLTRSQAEAWSARGVCCNAIAPGMVRTPLTEQVFADPQRVAAMAGRTMVGRNGDVADFGGLAVFLAGPSSAYLTGQTIFLDGGLSVT